MSNGITDPSGAILNKAPSDCIGPKEAGFGIVVVPYILPSALWNNLAGEQGYVFPKNTVGGKFVTCPSSVIVKIWGPKLLL
jgi:hypothetical protein